MAFISSKIPSKPSESDIIITRDPPEFLLAGLKIDSVIKLDKISTFSKNLIIGEIGEVGEIIRRSVNEKLCKILSHNIVKLVPMKVTNFSTCLLFHNPYIFTK